MDNALLKEIYQKYKKEIYIYIFSICKNKPLTEDLVQETFLKALLSLPDSSGNLRAWLYKVARNLTFNELKKQKRLKPLEENENPYEDFSLSDERLMLLKALSKLKPEKREILLFQYVGGLGQKEIAKILNISPENVRVLSFRAKKELKTYLEGK